MQLRIVRCRWALFNAVQRTRLLPTCSQISAANRRLPSGWTWPLTGRPTFMKTPATALATNVRSSSGRHLGAVPARWGAANPDHLGLSLGGPPDRSSDPPQLGCVGGAGGGGRGARNAVGEDRQGGPVLPGADQEAAGERGFRPWGPLTNGDQLLLGLLAAEATLCEFSGLVGWPGNGHRLGGTFFSLPRRRGWGRSPVDEPAPRLPLTRCLRSTRHGPTCQQEHPG